MMIAPTQAFAPTTIDLVAYTTRLWGHLLLAPLTWAAPGAPVLPAPPPPALVATPAAAPGTSVATADAPVTDHALLALLGHFAQHLGLITLLEAVPIDQKQVEHTPQSKLIEFLVGILAGIDFLQDLNKGPAPLAHDLTLAQAWGQAAFAHYSGVSRTLAAADDVTLRAVQTVLAQVSRPFIHCPGSAGHPPEPPPAGGGYRPDRPPGEPAQHDLP